MNQNMYKERLWSDKLPRRTKVYAICAEVESIEEPHIKVTSILCRDGLRHRFTFVEMTALQFTKCEICDQERFAIVEFPTKHTAFKTIRNDILGMDDVMDGRRWCLKNYDPYVVCFTLGFSRVFPNRSRARKDESL